MVELPKTEQELNALIEEKLNAKVEEMTSKHNGEMASLRKSYDEKIKKAQEQANLTAEEKALQLAKEKEQETQKELVRLQAFEKSTLLKERLTKENLPAYFANDNRLLTAEVGDLDKVIKVVKGEYEASLPKGNSHSSVVQVTTTTNPNGGGNGNKEKANAEVNSMLKEMVGN